MSTALRPKRENKKSTQELERQIKEVRIQGKLLEPVDELARAFELADEARDILKGDVRRKDGKG